MGRFTAVDCPAADKLVEDAIKAIGAQIEALAVPHLQGVVLGGGYGRGEGGVRVDGSLSNDLDFYVVSDTSASNADLAAINAALEPLSREWTERLGIDVDFCGAKTPWRIKHDEERLMIQELVNSYIDVAGAKGEKMFAHIVRRAPALLPWGEAMRLLVNRGAGLLLAAESKDETFIVRNIVKCILGSGDARLIAAGRYAWHIKERAARLNDSVYSRAVEWKLTPKKEGIVTWEEARNEWLCAAESIYSRPVVPTLAQRAFNFARWIVRRKSLGPVSSLGLDPIVRIFLDMRELICARASFPAALKKSWQIFN